MKRIAVLLILVVAPIAGGAAAQERVLLGNNAALRYWSAFAEMQDAGITDAQAKQLNLMIGGTAPYDDLKYRDLVEKNKIALETMARGSSLPNCDWGVDYPLGTDAPVEYVRKSLTLGRLNVLYAFHLLQIGDVAGGVRAIAAGLRFSHDVAKGGTLFAAVSAKDLLDTHLGAVAFAIHKGALSAQQRSALNSAIAQLGPNGIDWQAAMRRELSIVPGQLRGITPVYVSALDNPSRLPELQRTIAAAPQPLRDAIPNPTRVLAAKKDLADRLAQTLALLR